MKTILHTSFIALTLILSSSKAFAQTTDTTAERFFNKVQNLLIDSSGNIILQEKINALLKKDTAHSNVQISLVPPLSTNGKQAGNTINMVSLNILGGYSMGTQAVEVGGLFNLDKGSVRYVQAAGLLNLSGGNVTGVQMAGLMNKAWISTTGVQAAGLINLTKKNVTGTQAAGLMNLTGHSVKGVQAAGLINLADSFRGAQAAGLMNLTAQGFHGAQLAGLLNVGTHTAEGLQAAGIWNNADTVNGAQVSGIGNLATIVEGTQIAGVINRARIVRGCQIGLINLSDTCKGVPIGLFSYSRKGYHKLEVSGDEVIYTQVGFRTGVERFQNIFFAGINPVQKDYTLWTYGFGVGTKFPINHHWAINVDLSSQQLIRNDNFEALSILNKCFLAAEFQLAPKFSIALGPTFNVYVCNTKDSDYNALFKDIPPYSIYSHTFDDNRAVKMWVGGKIALRFF